jgi:hypothetical protein
MSTTPARMLHSRVSRSSSSRPNGRSRTRRTTRSSNGSTSPAACTARSPATTRWRTASGSSRRPVTRRDTSRWSSRPPAARRVLAGQACYTVGEWVGDTDSLEGRSSAPDQTAYDGSIRKLRASRPTRVGVRARPARVDPVTGARLSQTGYPSRAVLGGELAVPCTCNPLQQG